MVCPKCESKTTVYAIAGKTNNSTSRYRKCISCNCHFKTIETIVSKENIDNEKAMESLLLKISSDILAYFKSGERKEKENGTSKIR